MNDNIVYCKEECSYTKCVRNKKRAGPGAKCISSDQFIGCHVRTYGKEWKVLSVESNKVTK